MRLVKERKNGDKFVEFTAKELRFLCDIVKDSDINTFPKEEFGKYQTYSKTFITQAKDLVKGKKGVELVTVKITAKGISNLIMLVDCITAIGKSEEWMTSYQPILDGLRKIVSEEKYSGIKVDGKWVEDIIKEHSFV